MEVQITINCDNAAFEPYPENEVTRILRDVAARIAILGGVDDSRIADLNGNTVGFLKVIK